MIILIAVLLLIFALGYLAQTTGLCMIRGVNEWKNGDPAFLLAVLMSGVLAWVAAITGHYLNLPLQLMISSFDKWSGCLLNKVSQQLMIVGWYIFLGLTSISVSFIAESFGCFVGMLIVV